MYTLSTRTIHSRKYYSKSTIGYARIGLVFPDESSHLPSTQIIANETYLMLILRRFNFAQSTQTKKLIS
jgi:hypothetical protein